MPSTARPVESATAMNGPALVPSNPGYEVQDVPIGTAVTFGAAAAVLMCRDMPQIAAVIVVLTIHTIVMMGICVHTKSRNLDKGWFFSFDKVCVDLPFYLIVPDLL